MTCARDPPGVHVRSTRGRLWIDDRDDVVEAGQVGVVVAQGAQPDHVRAPLEGTGLMGDLPSEVVGVVDLILGEEDHRDGQVPRDRTGLEPGCGGEDAAQQGEVSSLDGVERGLLGSRGISDESVYVFVGPDSRQVEDREVLAGDVAVGAGEDVDRLLVGERSSVLAEKLL